MRGWLVILGLLFMAGSAWGYLQGGSIDPGIWLFLFGLVLLGFGLFYKRKTI